MTWEAVLDLSPLRFGYMAKAVRRMRAEDTASAFDANAAVIGDEKALNRINNALGDDRK